MRFIIIDLALIALQLSLSGCTEIENAVITIPSAITEEGQYRVWIDATLENGSTVTASQVVTVKILGHEEDSERAPINSGYGNGHEEATIFLRTFEDRYQYLFGGDGSIRHFFLVFEIPLKWDQWQDRAGQPVTDEEMQDESAALITIATVVDYSRVTQYHLGALDALHEY